MNRRIGLFFTFFLGACSSSVATPDAGSADARAEDADLAHDAGESNDVGTFTDASDDAGLDDASPADADIDAGLAHDSGEPSDVGPTDAGPADAGGRRFLMGNLPVPIQPSLSVPPTVPQWIETFDVIALAGEIVLTHAHPDWEAFVSTTDPGGAPGQGVAGTDFVAQMAAMRNLELFIVIDYRGLDGTGFGAPSSVGSSFSDPEVRSAFKNFSERLARDYQPAFMGIGSEVNTHLHQNPGELSSYASLLAETSARVRAVSPSTSITSTFQFEELVGLVHGSSEWNILDALEDELDMVAITTYPSLFMNGPAAIPANYYSQVTNHTTLPIIIAESGYPSGGDPAWHGSPTNQADFLSRIVELTSAMDLRVWIYWFIHDHEAYAPYFRTMGLRTSSGQPKPAFTVWQSIHDGN